MKHYLRHWPGLPYVVALFGFLLTVLAWYWLRVELHLLKVTHLHLRESIYPWTLFIIGICLTLILAGIVHIAQVHYSRSIALRQMNADLKKEIQERIAAEETKQRLEIALLQGQKLQSIGTLAAGIAHDFNNILYAIIGYTQLAQEDVNQDTTAHKNLGNVLEAAHRGQELISRILSFSRRQQQAFEAINLRTTIEAALALLRPTIPASVTIDFPMAADAVIMGNQTQLHQVLVNLINNAVDAMDGEGAITITMNKVKTDSMSIKYLPEIEPGNFWQIDINDTGHGMDTQTKARVFEPFFTTKEVGKGTGLGMSIVHTIIKEHGGDIFVKSQLGMGTTFTILLPEYQAKE